MDEFLAVNAKPKANDIAPSAIGTKVFVDAAGWFRFTWYAHNGLRLSYWFNAMGNSYTDPRCSAKTFEQLEGIGGKRVFLRKNQCVLFLAKKQTLSVQRQAAIAIW